MLKSNEGNAPVILRGYRRKGSPKYIQKLNGAREGHMMCLSTDDSSRFLSRCARDSCWRSAVPSRRSLCGDWICVTECCLPLHWPRYRLRHHLGRCRRWCWIPPDCQCNLHGDLDWSQLAIVFLPRHPRRSRYHVAPLARPLHWPPHPTSSLVHCFLQRYVGS